MTYPSNPAFAVLGIDLPETYTVNQDLLHDIEPDASEFGPKRFEMDGRSSHVLLSVCGAEENAVEKYRRGVFTSALLSLLQEKGVGKLTYTDIVMDPSNLPDQTLREASTLCRIRASSGSDTLGQYVLETGEAHGITNDAQFHVCTERTIASNLIAVLVSGTGMPFSIGYALQTGGSEEQGCYVLLELASRCHDIWDNAVEGMENKGKNVSRLVESGDKSKEPVVTANHDAFHRFHFEIMERKAVDCTD
ncbi:hypothetical protein IW262DRAFT_1557649 [Armillaria fumosa]|nr:hypothetical protein IW262DRAFT_1557649 [Armillaria fumosa]